MHHRYETHTDCRNPGECPICDGGLSRCTVCGGAEGSLTTDCPGSRISTEMDDAVYAGAKDYVNGAWVDTPSKHSPEYTHRRWKEQSNA